MNYFDASCMKFIQSDDVDDRTGGIAELCPRHEVGSGFRRLARVAYGFVVIRQTRLDLRDVTLDPSDLIADVIRALASVRANRAAIAAVNSDALHPGVT